MVEGNVHLINSKTIVNPRVERPSGMVSSNFIWKKSRRVTWKLEYCVILNDHFP